MKLFAHVPHVLDDKERRTMIDRAVNYSDMLISNGRMDPLVRAALQHDLEDHFNELIETDQTQEDIAEIQRILIQLELDGQKLT